MCQQELEVTDAKLDVRVSQLEAQRIPKILNEISQKMITEKVRELLTPMQLKQSLENKELK